MTKLTGKVALVTGSGRGIGQAIAFKLASEGAKVVVNDLDADVADATVKAIKEMGSDAVACVGDVTTADFGKRIVDTAVDTFDGMDIIVNNAGYPWDAIIHKMTDEQFQAMLDVHTIAPFRILRAASEFIRPAAKAEAEAGNIVNRKVVNISSIAGLYGNVGQMGYSAGKSALVGMTRTLAKEWGRYNVNVNCVAFGYIKTRITEPWGEEKAIAQVGDREISIGIPPQMIDGMNRMIPMGRGGTPEEAAGAVYLMCAPESDYISGQVVMAAGGLII